MPPLSVPITVIGDTRCGAAAGAGQYQCRAMLPDNAGKPVHLARDGKGSHATIVRFFAVVAISGNPSHYTATPGLQAGTYLYTLRAFLNSRRLIRMPRQDWFIITSLGTELFGEVAEWLKAHAWKVCIR